MTMFDSKPMQTAPGVVALFNASDDTIDMIQTILKRGGSAQTLVWCHFADLKKGIVDFVKYVHKHDPEVVVFDISPPYHANWEFYKTMRDAGTMSGRGSVLTTTNKARLDEVLGTDSHALEIVGNPEDLNRIEVEIATHTRRSIGAPFGTNHDGAQPMCCIAHPNLNRTDRLSPWTNG
jgi:DNA-binding response OmpR family regulator